MQELRDPNEDRLRVKVFLISYAHLQLPRHSNPNFDTRKMGDVRSPMGSLYLPNAI